MKDTIFLAASICDLGLEIVEWTDNWIAKVGDDGASEGRYGETAH